MDKLKIKSCKAIELVEIMVGNKSENDNSVRNSEYCVRKVHIEI